MQVYSRGYASGLLMPRHHRSQLTENNGHTIGKHSPHVVSGGSIFVKTASTLTIIILWAPAHTQKNMMGIFLILLPHLPTPHFPAHHCSNCFYSIITIVKSLVLDSSNLNPLSLHTHTHPHTQCVCFLKTLISLH